MKSIFRIVLAITVVSLVGCATIIGSPTQLIPISSTPDDANIVITDEKGLEIFKGKTPTTVTLSKSDGSYWGKKSYSVTITKDGYQSQTIPVVANANGWYIGGNLIFGGLIGWFIVDPLNGNMYTLSPESVAATLKGPSAHNNTKSDGSISIMLIDNVPLELRNKMQKLN